MKKNDNLLGIISLLLIVAGAIGFALSSGIYLWLGLLGGALIIIRHKTQPTILGKIFLVFAILAIVCFLFVFVKALV